MNDWDEVSVDDEIDNKAKRGKSISGGAKVWHVLPVTDDGGSTAEIVRVLGGPAVGDIRSRLLRLAPGTTNEARAVRRLLGHRLVSMESWKEKQTNEVVSKEVISRMAREEWLDILEGGQDGNYEHRLWREVSTPYRSIIRSFLVHFHSQLLQTHNGLRHSASFPPFDFTGGSVGNFFFAGARTFFGSLPAAIFLFSKVAGIPSGSRVVPAVLTEERLVLGAELKNGVRLRGQYNISHPKPAGVCGAGHRPVVKSESNLKDDILSLHPAPIERITYLLHDPTWTNISARNDKPMWKRMSQLHPTKAQDQSPTKVKLGWTDRHEIHPEPNPLVLDAISNASCIIYGCGSLFTSVLPSLVLNGVGKAIVELNGRPAVPKILLLNGWHDKETSWTETVEDDMVVRQMDATACVRVIVDALDQRGKWSRLEEGIKDEDVYDLPLVTDYVTHILYPIGTEIELKEKTLLDYCLERKSLRDQHLEQDMIEKEVASIKLVGVKSIPLNSSSEGKRIFHPPSLVDAILDLANRGHRQDSMV
jgi:2-phospho-L-lactate transferase/gluconeogenesis factor (CofD/UPF0052 family)